MSDSLALSITVPAARVPRFVVCLDDRLAPDGRVTAALLERAAADGTALALAFRLPVDAVLAAFAAEHPDVAGMEPGRVAVGAVFLTARRVGSGIEVTFTTTARALVTVLRESPVVRRALLALAQLGDPAEVRVLDEWNDVTVWRADLPV